MQDKTVKPSRYCQRRGWHLIWQPLCATLFICIVLYVFNVLASSDILWAVGAGSLASSCYIVFGKPSSPAAMPSKLIGGYLIGILSGEVMRLVIMLLFPEPQSILGIHNFLISGVLSALTVGLCLFFMSLLRLEHPPAAGMALVLVIDMRHYDVLTVIFAAALVLGFLRLVLGRYLTDLT